MCSMCTPKRWPMTDGRPLIVQKCAVTFYTTHQLDTYSKLSDYRLVQTGGSECRSSLATCPTHHST